MIVAVCGYNATGKSTVVQELKRRFEDSGMLVEVKKFAKLYPGTYIGRKKAKRNPTVSTEGKVGIRTIEAQRGDWNQQLGWFTFANLIVASFLSRILAIIYRKRLLIFDRFVYDRYLHFSPHGLLFGFAKRLGFRPALTLILLPSFEEHEKRFLDRLKDRHGIELTHFSDEDRDELRMVHQRYREMAEDFPDCMLIDTSNPGAHRQIFEEIIERLRASQLLPAGSKKDPDCSKVKPDKDDDQIDVN